ncbi:hypothetical protein GCM10010399_48310 [Dactylosporangium fulvum]|uniref:Uncharacterized protein n=1 Tax=Dactylosporangium fulvum TaxID=53359 RepID=A0ABY5VTG3_9ACTN|nr:hypothetical protein [Dactylosporangium fulvum]UWP80565.1 hypothetical protein Dfulv_36165 [Dactylosporangium fulvum]
MTPTSSTGNRILAPGPRELARRQRDGMVLTRIFGVIFAGAGLFALYGAFTLLDG